MFSTDQSHTYKQGNITIDTCLWWPASLNIEADEPFKQISHVQAGPYNIDKCLWRPASLNIQADEPYKQISQVQARPYRTKNVYGDKRSLPP